ncbi:TRAP transporter small permease [Chloroflexota bacterium]
MSLVKCAQNVGRIIKRITRWFHSAGEVVLAAMMFLTAADVSLRYLFNKPIMGSYELIEYMLVLVVAFTLAYCAVEKGHVFVELIIDRFPKRVQAIMKSFNSIVGLAFFSLITWYTFLQAGVIRRAGQTSAALYIPDYPFLILTSIGFGILSLIFLIQLIEYISQAAGKWNQSQ